MILRLSRNILFFKYTISNCCLFKTAAKMSSSSQINANNSELHRAVAKFIEYLRINTAHPTPDYASAMRFLNEYAREVGFDNYQQVEVHPGKTVLIFSYYGRSPDKKSILLNSHTDVVPVDKVREILKRSLF